MTSPIAHPHTHTYTHSHERAHTSYWRIRTYTHDYSQYQYNSYMKTRDSDAVSFSDDWLSNVTWTSQRTGWEGQGAWSREVQLVPLTAQQVLVVGGT